MTNISLQHFPLLVLDVDEALTFYRDGLGLSVAADVANGDFRWVTLSFPGQTNGNLVLSTPGSGRSDDDAQVIAEQVAKGSFGPLVLAAPQLDELYESLVAAGFEALQEPKQQPWGPRDCAFRDPSGNMVRINEAG